MKLKLSAADEAFRQEVRAFMMENLPADMAERTRTAVHASREDMLGWTKILNKKGWAVPAWPVEYGGMGWTPLQLYIFEEESLLAGAPMNNMQAISLVGPVIYTFGSQEQRDVYLPDIRDGNVLWAQGFSEPNSGSDLASLRTRADLDGDEYVITGQKIWTSYAQVSDYIFCIVRTSTEAKPQQGISFILVPTKSKGVTVRTIVSIDEGVSLCEVFFDQVRVPKKNLVGEAGKGWSYAKFLLGNERTFNAEVPRNKRNVETLKQMAAIEQAGGRPLIDVPSFALRLAQHEIDVLAVEASVLRDLALPHDAPRPFPIASVVKTRGSELLQNGLEMQVEALGVYGAVAYPHLSQAAANARDSLVGPRHAPEVTSEFLYRRASSIYGGTNEIQRNILSKILLSMTPTSTSDVLEDDQLLLRDSVERWVQKTYAFDARNAVLKKPEDAFRANWPVFAEMGWLGLGVPEDAGGLGGKPADMAILLEAFGSGLVIEPFLGAAVLAAQAIDKAGNAAQRETLLGGLVAGEILPALAYDEVGARGAPEWISTSASKSGASYRLTGKKCMVLGGTDASHYIISARISGKAGDRDGVALFVVTKDAAGISRADYRNIDNHRACDLTLKDVEAELLGAPDTALDALEWALDNAAIGACAETVGAMEKAFWVTVDYLKTRQQFGTYLKDFQALQHRLADMFIRIELSRSILYRGLEALEDSNVAARKKAVSASKVYIGLSGKYVGGQTIQLHGGIGLTEECAVGHYYKRFLVLDVLFGNADYHLNRFQAL